MAKGQSLYCSLTHDPLLLLASTDREEYLNQITPRFLDISRTIIGEGPDCLNNVVVRKHTVSLEMSEYSGLSLNNWIKLPKQLVYFSFSVLWILAWTFKTFRCFKIVKW